MKYPLAGDLQRQLGVELTGNPCGCNHNPAPHENPWEVRSDSGLEGVFADGDDAEFHAEELRKSGARGVEVKRRQRPPIERVQLAPAHNPGDRLFIGVYPAGIVYADRATTVDGDYARIAFLPYSTLQLEWSKGQFPPELCRQIVEHAATIAARRGQPFEVSSSGQTVVLGNPADLTAKGERMYKHVLASVNLKADATKQDAKRIAAATVASAARRGVPGLKRKR